MEVTKKALYLGIEQAQVGNRIGDIGHAIQSYVEGENLAVVRDFIGHGVGPTIHEEPAVPHYGEAGKGLRPKRRNGYYN
jgi:methionyl aminopeptidase